MNNTKERIGDTLALGWNSAATAIVALGCCGLLLVRFGAEAVIKGVDFAEKEIKDVRTV